MEIKQIEAIVDINALCPGDIFIKDGVFYMTVADLYHNENKCIRCVRLDSGLLDDFDCTEEVQQVDAVLTVKIFK